MAASVGDHWTMSSGQCGPARPVNGKGRYPPETVDPTSLRTVPVQERARQTVERVLAAAAQLLAEGGPDELTTSAVAARAGLKVRNVYRYFPDRAALAAALADRLNGAVEHAIGDLSDLADPVVPWQGAVRSAIRRLVAAGAEHPEAVQIRAAMRSNPELQLRDLESDVRIADAFFRALRTRGVRPAGPRLSRRMFVLVTAVGAVLDRGVLGSAHTTRALFTEAEELAIAYLTPLIEAQA